MGHLSALKFALFTLTLYFLSATERNTWGSQEHFRQRRTDVPLRKKGIAD